MSLLDRLPKGKEPETPQPETEDEVVIENVMDLADMLLAQIPHQERLLGRKPYAFRDELRKQMLAALGECPIPIYNAETHTYTVPATVLGVTMLLAEFDALLLDPEWLSLVVTVLGLRPMGTMQQQAVIEQKALARMMRDAEMAGGQRPN